MLEVGLITRTKIWNPGDDEELPWMKKTSYTRLMNFFKGTHYCCCYYFLIESSCHVTFKVNVIISHRNFFFLLPSKKTNKHLGGKLTNLHLHYHANLLLALYKLKFSSSLFPHWSPVFIFHPQI